MAKTLPTLVPTASIADDTLLLVRRAGQTRDESALASVIKAYIGSGLAVSGGTIDNTVIGGTTPAAATVTNLTATGTTTLNTSLTGVLKATAGVVATGLVDLDLEVTSKVSVAHGGTGASDAAGARANLGVGTAGTRADSYFAQTANNLSDLANAATARTNLGLGTIATQASSNVTITGGSISGITDLAVADGGTGASNASDARTNLGVAIGTDVQAYDAGLASIAGLTTQADRSIYTTASDTYAVYTLTSYARTLLDDANASTARTTLGLGTIATQDASAVAITGGSIAGITDLAVADGGTGASDASGARTNLGLGTIATQNANNVTISGGSITGIADLAIADGGTGASTRQAAFDNLSPNTTAGDITYHNGTNNVRLAKGSNGQVLKLTSGLPSWAFAPLVAGWSVPPTLKIIPVTPSTSAPTQYTVTTGDDPMILHDGSGNIIGVSNLNLTLDRAVTGAGGIGSGLSIGNSTWYSMWVISDGSTPALLLADTSLTTIGTYLPSGYTFRKHIGWIKTHTNGTFLRLGQNGKLGYWLPTSGTTMTLYPNLGTSGSYAAFAWGAWAPPSAVEIEAASHGSAGSSQQCALGDVVQTARGCGGGWTGTGFPADVLNRLPLHGPNIYASTTNSLTIAGWVDGV